MNSIFFVCLCVFCVSLVVECSFGVEKFYNIVKKLPVTSDKITTHSYQEMYGLFLLPFIKEFHQNSKNIKFFEIGMGCAGDNFYGGSVEIWNSIFSSQDELWTADWQGGCIDKARAAGKLYNFKTLVGDQSNVTVLREWMKISGGKFDVIIDDGGHTNKQIHTTVYELWDHLLPGGLYFIEDVQIGRNPGYNVDNVFSDVVQQWIEQLLINEPYTKKVDHKIPPLVKSIYCQSEACVIFKCGINDLGRCEHIRKDRLSKGIPDMKGRDEK